MYEHLKLNEKDELYLTEVIDLIEEADLTSDEKEYRFLVENKGINQNGEVACEYPKLFYRSGGEVHSHDEGGVMIGLNTKREQLNSDGKSAWIEYVPRFYSFYVMARKELDQTYKER